MQNSPATIDRPSRVRSQVTNGRRTFVDGDGKSAWARRRRDVIELHVSDMGGWDALSEAQISLATRAAVIQVELEQMEGKLSMGEEVNLDAYTRAAGHLRRILETIGIERRPRDVTSIVDILREHSASKSEAAQ